MQPLLSPLLWRIAGALSLALGAIGIVVPVLPTTPFVLLAAFCFARGSPALHRWLLANRAFGPLLRDWEEHRSIERRTKIVAIAAMSISLASSIVFAVDAAWLQVTLALLGVGLAIGIYRIPSRDHPSQSRGSRSR
jgi:uncharacterized membrane protein YbaN (DUF454 family)